MASVSKRVWTYKGAEKTAWVVRYVDRTGSHRQKTFARKKDADNYRTRVEYERAESGHIAYIAPKTVGEVARAYGIHVDRRLEDGQIKRGSHKNIVQALRVSIVPRLGKMNMADLTADDCERWFMALRKEDRLAPKTAQERLIKLSAMLDFAIRRDLAKKNPAKSALENIGGLPSPRVRDLTPEQVRHLLATAATKAKWQHEQTFRLTLVACHIAAFSGLRIGEILALRLSDVDLAGRRIHVRHTVNEWDELTTPKTPSSLRTVPMPPHVVDLLRAYIARYYLKNDRDLVFRGVLSRKGKVGGPIGVARFNAAYWRPLTVRAGLDDPDDHVHFHALRHFAASWWLGQQMPIAEASKLMGHASPMITLGIYTHALMREDERTTAIDTMAETFLAPPDVANVRNAGKALSYQAL